MSAKALLPLPCPFCGSHPIVEPTTAEKQGGAWGAVQCVNRRCVTYSDRSQRGVEVRDGALQNDDRGSAGYQRLAIRRWNRRRFPSRNS